MAEQLSVHDDITSSYRETKEILDNVTIVSGEQQRDSAIHMRLSILPQSLISNKVSGPL